MKAYEIAHKRFSEIVRKKGRSSDEAKEQAAYCLALEIVRDLKDALEDGDLIFANHARILGNISRLK